MSPTERAIFDLMANEAMSLLKNNLKAVALINRTYRG